MALLTRRASPWPAPPAIPGQELLRLLARHPAVTITAATSSGATSARRLPALTRLWNGTITPLDASKPDALARDADVVFLALPDKAAAELAPALVDAGARVIDLSGAFRLRGADARGRWYPDTHRMPDGLAYGLTELQRGAVAGARMVANPGCYPTATLLAVAPIAAAGLLAAGADVIVDAKSGVSGAGKTPSERTHFSEVHGSLGRLRRVRAPARRGNRAGRRRRARRRSRRARGELRAASGARSIAASCRRSTSAWHPAPPKNTLAAVYERTYAGATFVRLVGSALPEIKHVAHTNFCDIGWRVDASGRVVLVSVIDNLLKGASGQAVQNMNVMLGLDETTGLL